MITMDKLEQMFLVLFFIWLGYLIYTNWKCNRYHRLPKVTTPEDPVSRIKSKFEVGDYIQELHAPVIKKVTGFYVTEKGSHMTTAITVETYGYKVEQRNQSSTAYCTVALNTYYKKIEYGK